MALHCGREVTNHDSSPESGGGRKEGPLKEAIEVGRGMGQTKAAGDRSPCHSFLPHQEPCPFMLLGYFFPSFCCSLIIPSRERPLDIFCWVVKKARLSSIFYSHQLSGLSFWFLQTLGILMVAHPALLEELV
jgi:hypothetical protein